MSKMELLMLCPANVATGGTESIHRACNELNKQEGIHASILYRRVTDQCPQPKEYAEYEDDYLTELPKNFTGAVIFPEIWADMAILPEYDKCVKAINWAGVDVYKWNTRPDKRYQFLKTNCIHLVHSDYARNYMKELGVADKDVFSFSGNLNAVFYQEHEEFERSNTVLYNPVKRTDFDWKVIEKAKEQDIKFKAIENMTREQVLDTMLHSKLYIDFGVFSGRERIPREAVMCGCCILTSDSGAAGYYKDVPIPEDYKFDNQSPHIQEAVNMIKAILINYEGHKKSFDYFRTSLRQDMKNFGSECEVVAKELLRRYDEI